MTNLSVSGSGLNRLNNIDSCSETIRSHRLSEHESNVFFKLVSNAIIHALETLLAALLSPILIWQWIANHYHFMVVFKIIIEVILELMMLIVFAGVSIFTAAALIFEDLYKESQPTAMLHRRNESEKKNNNKKK